MNFETLWNRRIDYVSREGAGEILSKEGSLAPFKQTHKIANT